LSDLAHVWVFSGADAHFPGAVFSDRARAEQWIASHKLTGTLTLYPVDVGAYEWAIENGWFKPSKPHQLEPQFIGGFGCGHEHYHYEGGIPC
jgi:hypothetical protein